MYKGIDIKGVIKTTSITDYSKGNVVINNQPSTLNANNYVTRIKNYVNKA